MQRYDELYAPLPPAFSESHLTESISSQLRAHVRRRRDCQEAQMAQDRWYAPAVPFVAGAVAWAAL